MTPVFVHHSNREDYKAACDFVSRRVFGDSRNMGEGTALVVIEGDRAVAVAVMHNYNAHTGVIEISAASDSKRWLTRPVLRAMFGYIFNELGCQVAVTRIDAANRSLMRIMKAYGFKIHVIPRLRGRDKSEAVCVLADDAWKANGFHKEREYESATADAA